MCTCSMARNDAKVQLYKPSSCSRLRISGSKITVPTGGPGGIPVCSSQNWEKNYSVFQDDQNGTVSPHNVIGRRARGKCKPRILANGKRFGPSKSAALRPDAAWCMAKNGHSTFSAVAQLHQPTSASRQLALLGLFDLALIRVRIHRQRVSPAYNTRISPT